MISQLLHSALSVVFPTFCPACNERLINHPDEICEHCLATLPRTNEVSTQGNITEDKFVDIPNFVSGASWLHYNKTDTVISLIHKFKYQQHPWIGYYLARTAAKEYIPWGFFDTIDLIMPVPLHPKRLRERGYNQAEWIARGLNAEIGIDVDTTHLTRAVNNEHQARQMGLERTKNVTNIFTLNHPEELYRKHILLVDDVITTGATLRSCIEALHPARGCKISVFSLTKAGKTPLFS